jgi:hypothetical protein
MPEDSSVRPEDITVEAFVTLDPGFHAVDEDPADPIGGYDETFQNGNGTWTHA